MITMEDYKQMFSADREKARCFSREFRSDVGLLKSLHNDDRMTHNPPQKTIDEFVYFVGYQRACYIIANMVNARAEWDGRISPKNAEWAKERAELDRELVIWLGGYADDAIHSCHLDQLCSEMRRRVG